MANETNKYNLRSLNKDESPEENANDHQEDYESSGGSDDTIVERPEHQPNQMDAILSCLDTLRVTVTDLQRSQNERITEMDLLRQQVQTQSSQLTTAYVSNEPTVQTTNNIVLENVGNVKLYDLPVFSGNAEEWPLFNASFKDTTQAFKYNNRHNLMRLQKCLVGAAKEAVTSMLIYPQDVNNAMEELQFRFGRPDILVKSQLQKIQQLPVIRENRLEEIIPFATSVRNVVAFLESASCQQHLANPLLLEQLVSKLPTNRQFEWASTAANIRPYPTVIAFSKWLGEVAKVVCLMPTPVPVPNSSKTTTPQSQTTKRFFYVNENTPRTALKCFYCGDAHLIVNCKTFMDDLSTSERWEKVKQLRLCFSCLYKGHNSSECRNRKTCNVNGCKRQHHPSLHEEQNQVSPTSLSGDGQAVLSCRLNNIVSDKLFKILPVKIFGPNGEMKTFAMFDEGSSISLLDAELANSLGLRGQSDNLTLQWYGDGVTTEKSTRVNIEISADYTSRKYQLKNVYTVQNLSLPTQSFAKSEFHHMQYVPMADYEDAKPTLLIGLDAVHLSVSTTIVQSDTNQPVAAETKLGWVVYGPINAPINLMPRVLHIRHERSLKELDKVVEEYFSGDSVDISPTPKMLLSEDDTKAREILDNSLTRIDKHFEIGLLWKQTPPTLPNSFETAKNRLLGIEKRMNRDAVFAEKYNDEMDKYFEKGYARELTESETKSCSHPIWYLPHFGVVNPHKPDKFRIVFDAAAAVQGISLNSALMKGPEQAKPLFAILCKFREGVVAVAADIREMFSQVKIRAADQHAQRFLWRSGNSDEPIRKCVMTSMIFGAACSPCCAEYVKNHNALEHEQEYPEAAKEIVDNHYVDDFVSSFANEENAIEICKNVVNIHSGAGFELRNFVSNSSKLKNILNKSPTTTANTLNMERQAATEKVLGMFWNTETDTFKFLTRFHRIHVDVLNGDRCPTKRELLGIVMAVFDPYGLLADFLIFSKILAQFTWKMKIGWDELIPLELQDKWKYWWAEFGKVVSRSVNRCYSPFLSQSADVQLHIFVDASQDAFAAVGYLRIEYDGNVDVAFVCGKTRCAPLKLTSIPRLELCAAVLGTRLCKLIRHSHNIPISIITFWSDSQTVLHWINSATRRYKPFVGHRIAEILETSKEHQWKWVPTELNAADVATRPTNPPKFVQESRWITGPPFLLESDDKWPHGVIEIPADPLEEELKPCLLLKAQASINFIDFERFSSYLRLKRAVAWSLRFKRAMLQRVRDRENNKVVPEQLTIGEISEGEQLILKTVQQQAFAEEISLLKSGHPIVKQSSIFALSPYIDDLGIIRLSGRIDEALCLPFEVRRPVLLPQKHYVSELIMRFYHEKHHHQNFSCTLNELRHRFWMPHARSVLKSVQGKCMKCKISRVVPKPPQMGQLPSDRLTPYVRPFSYTGVDLFGPFTVTVGRRQEKRWAVIFTCMTVRAAHIELAENLSTDAFIICLRNFVNRRGTPIRIRSDNATNFIGAQRELAEAERFLDVDRIVEEATKFNIDWVFNCPVNPSSGGCWERLIRIVKRLLAHTLKEVSPRVETLRSVLIEAENIINSRPLTDVALSFEDDVPLTPNHFLIGCLNSTQTPHPVDEKICLRKQWRISQNLKDRMWKRWTVEYLPQLLNRQKWHEKPVPVKINDVVLICEPTLARSMWKMGRITAVFPAKDGQIRLAEVATATSILRRPVNRLAVLAIDGESPSDSRGVECNDTH